MIEQSDGAGVLRDLTEEGRRDALLIWDYHQMRHVPKPADVAIGLGSHDLGVASFAAELYFQRLIPAIVFSGANSPTTVARFPNGEAVHYRAHAVELGVPTDMVYVEPRATNTGQNIQYSRDLLAKTELRIGTVMLISKPYMQRRAFATCRKVWPEVTVICASEPIEFDEYVASIGDIRLVVDMLVGDLQRIIEHPRMGFAVEQLVPDAVWSAYKRLVDSGFTSRLMTT
jgi:uncharacterized SAM-binding protein YcdF (DUF218 family)